MIEEEPQRTDTNAAGAQRWGPSGAGIWSAPTLDPARNVLYVATGDNYSEPATANSDAIVAMSMETGEVLWVNQTTPGDAWTIGCIGTDDASRVGCPDDSGPDFDFGSSPVLTTLSNGQRVLLAGQKSGMLYGLDADDGTTLWETRVADGGIIGGIEWGIALEGDAVYAPISDAFEKGPGEAGGLAAVRLTSGEIVWEAPPFQDTCGSNNACNTGQPGAVTTIPGAVLSGSLDGHVRAYATDTGNVIWDFDTARAFATVNGVPARGGSMNGPGPTVAGGMLFVSSGYASYMHGNVLLAFSAGE
jgi:polyvinyl alcohol dehydrogenase (cytochrome)